MSKTKEFLKTNLPLIVFSLIAVFGWIKGSFSRGDFIGYILTAKYDAAGGHIYSIGENTWPPLFTIFCKPLANVTDEIRPVIYFFWLALTLLAFYFILKQVRDFLYGADSDYLLGKKGFLSINSWQIWIPLALMMKFLLDNLTNVQINIFFLLACLFMFKAFQKKQAVLVGFILAITISLKVYTIFIFFYFLYRRDFKSVIWASVFLVLLNGISFLYWGIDLATEYYTFWAETVTARSDFVDHKNQSIFGTFHRFLTTADPGHKMDAHIMDLSPDLVQRLVFGVIGIAALIPLYLFRKPMKDRFSFASIIEYSIVLNAIPILSPISWKAYYIFITLPVFLLFNVCYNSNIEQVKFIKTYKFLFIIALTLLTLSAELFTGKYFSDVLETYSAYTVGAVILLAIQLHLYFLVNERELIVKLNRH